MKIKNETLWVAVEGLANNYAESKNDFEKQETLAAVYGTMQNYIKTCVNNAVRNAGNYGLMIPKEDFESRILQYIWEALEAYTNDSESTFKNIVIRRIRFAEIHTWRQYRTKGDENDKDGYSYSSARWDSIDRKVGGSDSEDDKTIGEIVLGETESAEDEYIEQEEVSEILKEYEVVNKRYANVIYYMALGYSGDDLAVATGEADSNNAKMRKLIQRAKQSFAKFLDERKAAA